MAEDAILVTGSSGTIGTALVEELLAAGYEVHGVDSNPNRWSDEVNELTEQHDLREAVSFDEGLGDVDTVVHLAAHARVHELVKNPDRARENFEMTYNVLEFARKEGVENVILGSSREVYGNKSKIIYDEEDTYIDECESPYTASKIGSEAMLKSYQNCYGLRSCNLRFSNVYGKYDASDRVVPLFITQVDDGRDLVVYGEEKILDFTYIDDCVDGIMKVITQFGKAKNETFNIASGTGRSIVELAEYINDAMGGRSEVQVEPARAGEVHKYVADISKAKAVLGYDPSYSFHEGLEETINWYSAHPWIRDEVLP